MVTAVAWGALLTQAETICRGSPMVRILTVAKWPSLVLDLGLGSWFNRDPPDTASKPVEQPNAASQEWARIG
ncbi:hypothetical protein V8C34DRAFT_283226 [Trichoderma compactum]